MNIEKIIKLFIFLILISFGFSFAWEISHSFLYDWSKFPLKPDFDFYIFRILKSTIGDVIAILIIFLANSLLHKSLLWVNNIKPKDIIFLSLFGIFFALFFEFRAFYNNSWSYNQYMPLLFGFGLTPLIQLSISSIVTSYSLKLFLKKI